MIELFGFQRDASDQIAAKRLAQQVLPLTA